MRILLLLVVMIVSGCAEQMASLKNALPEGKFGDALKYGKEGSIKFNPFGEKDDDDLYGPRNESPNKLAFEDSNGLCDANKLPKGTAILRFDSLPNKFSDLSPVLSCELRYLHAAKSKEIPTLDKNELALCSRYEYLFKMRVEGGHTKVVLDNAFEIEKVVDKFTPMIQARVKQLKEANQFCISPKARSITVYHYDLATKVIPIAFSGPAEYGHTDDTKKWQSRVVTTHLPMIETMQQTEKLALTLPKDTGKSNASGGIFTETTLELKQSEEPFYQSKKVGSVGYSINFKVNKDEAKIMEAGTTPLSAIAFIKILKTDKKNFNRDYSMFGKRGLYSVGTVNQTQHSLVTKVSHFEMDYKSNDGNKKFVYDESVN